jgi:hypothetical protein
VNKAGVLPSHRTARRASYVCAALAAALLAAYVNVGLLPVWLAPIALLSGAIALAGAALAAFSLGSEGWSSLRHWPGQLALAVNAFLGIAFLAYASV